MNQQAVNTVSSESDQKLDRTGKAVFDGIYEAPDPRQYYQAMASLDYSIPEEAKPHFTNLFNECRKDRGKTKLKVLDLGCSYGINAVLLKCGISLEQLFNRYNSQEVSDVTSEELKGCDREYFSNLNLNPGVEFIGFDISENALGYAEQIGLHDYTVVANLEQQDASKEQAATISLADCVISSGCIGYVTEQTLLRIIDSCGEYRPWMAHCVLRMFDPEPIVSALQTRGYEVDILTHLIPQRRFVSPAEQQTVIDRLLEMGVDPEGYESEGWLYARVITAIPKRSS